MLKTYLPFPFHVGSYLVVADCFAPLNKRYSAKWRYFVWLIAAIRLIIPVRIELPEAL